MMGTSAAVGKNDDQGGILFVFPYQTVHNQGLRDAWTVIKSEDFQRKLLQVTGEVFERIKDGSVEGSNLVTIIKTHRGYMKCISPMRRGTVEMVVKRHE